MQNALSAYLRTIEGLLEDSEIEKAIQVLMDFDEQFQTGIRRDIIQQSGNFKAAQKQFRNGLIDAKEMRMATAQASNFLLQIMEGLPKRIELSGVTKSLSTFQFNIPDDARLDKALGSKENLLRISWLQQALQVSKAVCRVVGTDGSLGSGFLTRDGYLFTCNYVIPSAEAARTARIEFSYELDSTGAAQNRVTYDLDPADFSASGLDQLNFTRVRIIDRADQPLKQWGYLEFESDALPAPGDQVTLVEYPGTGNEPVALNANDVLKLSDPYLVYTADTTPGSGGSPVFNKNWRVVAIHASRITSPEGMPSGERKGILTRNILHFLDTGIASMTAKSPDPVPAEAPAIAAPAPPVSNIPKFVVIYDMADDAHCKLLNKHLNVLKITKKIRVYNVNDAPPGTDPLLQAAQEIVDADYLIVLLTVNLFNSADWFGVAFDALGNGRRMIPIRTNNVDIEGTGFEKLRSLPTLNRTIADFPNQDAAYLDIVGELRKLLPR